MQTEEIKKRKNRTKSFEALQARNYQCKCGKKYLSYSALYTHSKQKHSFNISTKFYSNENVDKKSSPFNKKTAEEENKNFCVIDLENSQKNSIEQHLEKIKFSKTHKETIKEVNVHKALIEFMSKQSGLFPKETGLSLNNVLACLVQYVNSHATLLQDYNSSSKYCENRTAQYLPFSFNHFFKEEVPLKYNVSDQKVRQGIIEILRRLGCWLFQNNYTMLQTNIQ